MMPPDLRRLGLPTRTKFTDEHHIMRVSHRNWNPPHLAKSQFNRKLVTHLRFSHGDLELELSFIVTGKRTFFYSSPGANRHLLSGLLGAKVSSYATGSISGYFGLCAVGVKQPGAQICILRGKEPLHTIGAYACMPVANAPAEACHIGRSMHAINDEEVISAGARFYEGNYSEGKSHSCSVLPNILTLEKTPDSCSRTFSSSSWVLTHFTENTTRELPSAETALISSMSSSSAASTLLSSFSTASVFLPVTSNV